MITQYKHIVDMDSVAKSFGDLQKRTTPLKNITLSADLGNLILLMGPSGSGKTTLLSIMAGLIPQSSGKVNLFGHSLIEYSTSKLRDIRLRKIGFVFQTFNLIDSMTSLENVALPLRFSNLTGLKPKDNAKTMLKNLSIDYLADKFPDNLSQGEKQRVALARAFINEPDLIIADEPSACLEESQGKEIIELLSNYAKDGKCVIVASHDSRLTKYADHIYYLYNGFLADKTYCDRKVYS